MPSKAPNTMLRTNSEPVLHNGNDKIMHNRRERTASGQHDATRRNTECQLCVNGSQRTIGRLPSMPFRGNPNARTNTRSMSDTRCIHITASVRRLGGFQIASYAVTSRNSLTSHAALVVFTSYQPNAIGSAHPEIGNGTSTRMDTGIPQLQSCHPAYLALW
jgi:hypothetical protein